MHRPSKLIVDLIIPARNEQSNITEVLKQLPASLLRNIIVVDNGSTDDTAKLARSSGAIVIHEAKPGYGGACLAGLKRIEQNAQSHLAPLPDAVAFIDADLSDDCTTLQAMIDHVINEQADMVIAGRVRLAKPGALTITQRFGNALACSLIYIATGRRYHDLGPMRIIRWRSLEMLDMKDRSWGWTVEMQYKAAAAKMTCIEIDSPYHQRQGGVSKISGSIIGSFKAGVKIIYTIIKLRLTYKARSQCSQQK